MGTTLVGRGGIRFLADALLNNSQVGQPQVPTTYQIVLQNTGHADDDLRPEPQRRADRRDRRAQPDVDHAQPGQSTLVASGTTSLNATITSTSATDLASFSFSILATAEGAPEISQASVAEFAARAASVQIISVATNPTFTNAGGEVDVSAQVLDAVNQQQQALVLYAVTDPSGNVVFTSQPVSTTLSVLSTLSTVDLGDFDTTNLADGEYTINVAVDDASGNPIPGATGQGTLLIGMPVTATLSIDTDHTAGGQRHGH